jgi:shikimate kinase
MGSGKSTVGRRVARALGRPFFECDQLVELRLGRSIPELFEAGDEPIFRAEEASLIADLVVERPAGVISLGGGALEALPTRELVLGSTAAVHLDRPVGAILASLERLRTDRPLLAGASDAEIARLYSQRAAAYRSCPITVPVGDLGVEDVVDAVLVALEAHGIVA